MAASPSNSQKIFFGRSINRFTSAKIRGMMFLKGKSLPASVVSVNGSIVTVQFLINSIFTLPQVAIPLVGPEYIRYPIQQGCLGIVAPADVFIGNVTGLGSSAPPPLTIPGNLSALRFIPLGNQNWTAPDDPNAVVVYGPNGVILRDTGKKCVLTIQPSGATLSGDCGDLTVDGNLSAGNGITGSFTTPTGQIVTVQNGIVTNIF
jgi:hypothetical protein